jgi:predicted AlkP superfamily phosphohydrolase/phosphomutase
VTAARRLLVIGLDAADPTLVERWAREGDLPTLGFLGRAAARIDLRHRGDIPSAAIWPTVAAGAHPGRHGLFHTIRLVPGTWTIRVIEPEESPEPPVWWHLDRAGVRSIVVDVPLCPSRADMGGIQIVDWGSYEHPRRAHSIPAGVLPALVRHAGAYPREEDPSREVPVGAAGRARARDVLVRGAAAKGAALRYLAEREPWDFFFAVFGEPHAAGHCLWPSGGGADGWGPLRDVYRAVDAEVGRLLDLVDPATTTVMVLSGQGMADNVSGAHLLEPVLARLGLLATGGGASAGGGGLLRRLRSRCPLALRRAVSRYLPQAVRTSVSGYWALGSLDRARTRAFTLPTDQLGFVRVNLAGREPGGIVAPGREYEAVCDEVAGALCRLVDARTGEPVVDRVFRADLAFPGPESYRLPDLLVSWRTERPIDAVCSPEVGTIAGTNPDLRTGNHRPQGFALLYGAGVPLGRRSVGHVLDLAPTVLDRFGIEAPAWMEGASWLRDAAPEETGAPRAEASR